MRILIAFLAAICFGEAKNNNVFRRWRRNFLGAPNGIAGTGVPERWFEQILDHFHPTDDRTWQQRYFVDSTHYKPGGPAFLMIGGEGAANPTWMSVGSWIDYAKQHNAICFQLEHRFYGKSHPTADMSVKNLAYLTSTQALADLAGFIEAMSGAYGLAGARWIAFGGSYPGSLAAWLRLKYPHLVHGSVSTSGPMVAQADFPEYLEVVEEAIDTTSPGCNALIQKGMKQVGQLTLHRVGWALLSKMFRLCTPFDGTDNRNVSNLMESIIGNFEDIIQYNRDNREFEGVATANITIDDLCEKMTSSDAKNPIEMLAKVNSFMLDSTGEQCLDTSYSSMIDMLMGTKWSSAAGVGARQWTYQTCTEFGWYQSSGQPGHPYTDTFNATFFERQCGDIFGAKFDLDLLERGINRTNNFYGGRNIHVDNVVFVHGSFDPWHALGITSDLNPGAPAILIPGTAHCANMYPVSPADPPQLTEARERIGQIISDWLK